jgi:hypothetical protein
MAKAGFKAGDSQISARISLIGRSKMPEEGSLAWREMKAPEKRVSHEGHGVTEDF